MPLDDKFGGLDDAIALAGDAFASAASAYAAFDRRLTTFREDILAGVRQWLPDTKLHDYRGSSEDERRTVKFGLPAGVFKGRGNLLFLANLLALDYDLEAYKDEHTVGIREVIDVFPLHDRTELTIRPLAPHAHCVLEEFLNRGLRGGRTGEISTGPFTRLAGALQEYYAALESVVPAAVAAVRGFVPATEAELHGEMLQLRTGTPVPASLADRWSDAVRPCPELEFRRWSSAEPEVVLHAPYWLSLAQVRSCGTLQLYPRNPAGKVLFTAYCDALKHRDGDAARLRQAQAIDLGGCGPEDFGGSDF